MILQTCIVNPGWGNRHREDQALTILLVTEARRPASPEINTYEHLCSSAFLGTFFFKVETV